MVGPPPATVGTAGHVDHGKSTLIHALTGIDPDRLADEKARGLTIDLGFAWLTLPSGRPVSFIDVPGHERFVHNMLAGVGGIQACLFVVAADEGVMPQTREHLDIVSLLGIDRGVIVLTKADLVEREWIELVESEVREAFASSSLAHAPMVRVSAVKLEGLELLVRTLEDVLGPGRAHSRVGRPRLPIDRSFSRPGFGTVVTGTLSGGPLGIGDAVHVYPGGRRTRVRGLQSHRASAGRVEPGQRVAINLGGVSPKDVPRGRVIAVPDSVTETRRVDTTLQLLPSAPRALKPGEHVSWHSGAAELVASVRYLERHAVQPGSAGWVQWRFSSMAVLRKGDLYVIRRLSPPMTIGGGEVVRTATRHIGRGKADAIAELELARRASPAEFVAAVVTVHGPMTPSLIARRTELTADVVATAVRDNIDAGRLLAIGGHVMAVVVAEALDNNIRAMLASDAEAGTGLRGLSRALLPKRLGVPPPLVSAILERLAENGEVELAGARVMLPGVKCFPNEGDAEIIAAILGDLDRGGFAPPSLTEVTRERGAPGRVLEDMESSRQIVRIAPDFGLTQDGYTRWLCAIGQMLTEQDRVTVGELRDRLRTSRKYALAFLEHLDARSVTRRVGDARVLIDRSAIPH